MLGQRVVYTINVQIQVLLMSVSISVSTLFFLAADIGRFFKPFPSFSFSSLVFVTIFLVLNQMFYSVCLSCCGR